MCKNHFWNFFCYNMCLRIFLCVAPHRPENISPKELLVALHGQLHERNEELVVDGEELDVRLLEQSWRELVEVEGEVAGLVDAADDFGGAGGAEGEVVELGEQVLDDEAGGQVDVLRFG